MFAFVRGVIMSSICVDVCGGKVVKFGRGGGDKCLKNAGRLSCDESSAAMAGGTG